MERYLPRALRGEDFRTDAWWLDKTAGMAAAMRDLKSLLWLHDLIHGDSLPLTSVNS
jgi:hypothetical protein